MSTLHTPFLELRADGTIRDADTEEIYGNVPVSLRDLYDAAPDLLAVCESLTRWNANDNGDGLQLSKICKAARRAVAKATGAKGRH